LGDVEELRGGVAGCGKGIAEHGVAEGAGDGDGLCSGCSEFCGSNVTYALTGFLA
jgi:hypothetical protein